MNRGQANQGMRCIRKIVSDYSDYLIVEEFDVRVKNQLPDLDFDIFISSGGPGNPLEGNGIWEHRFAHLVDRIWEHNKQEHVAKKHFFFICHSFQLACNHFGLGEITKRRSTSFGVYPVHKTEAGKKDVLLSTIGDPYWVVDSRDWQLIQPNLEVFEEKGAKILSLEKIRTHVELERAIMAVRFSDEMVGTQYHPEADPDGMEEHFKKEENRQKVIDNFGVEKYEEMMAKLADPDKLWNTHNSILPRFIEHALEKLCVIQPETV
ncbi:GMP synthase [Chitinophagales bacterium]|nr:GMP synthase [Chitinophagales bacterium]